MLRILVVGGFAHREDEEAMTNFGRALGAEIARQGHVLVSANRVDFDAVVAEATRATCDERGEDVDSCIISYVMDPLKPCFDFGRRILSQTPSWDPGKISDDRPPEPFTESDVVILVKGGQTTRRAADWSRRTRRPLLPVAYFGGTAAEVLKQEYDRFEEKYSGFVDKMTYEILREIGHDWEDKARRIVDLAENIVTSESVVASMSYSKDVDTDLQLSNLFESFEYVCRDFGYTCERVSEENVPDRILPTILRRIRRCAFLVVDLTDLRPNVLYELGYAEGRGKQIVVTARQGTDLPFNVKDMPVVFWNPIDQRRLRAELKKRVEAIAVTQGRKPGAPRRHH